MSEIIEEHSLRKEENACIGRKLDFNSNDYDDDSEKQLKNISKDVVRFPRDAYLDTIISFLDHVVAAMRRPPYDRPFGFSAALIRFILEVLPLFIEAEMHDRVQQCVKCVCKTDGRPDPYFGPKM